MSRERLAVMVEHQARGCAELGSPLYAFLLGRVAQDVRAGGPCAEALAGYEDAPGPDAVALRLLGGVHALALTGRAPDLAACYPSTGGAFDPERPEPCWHAFRAAVAGEMEWVRDWMTRPPQTNEVGRANLLITGLLKATQAGPLPVRLFEVGSSAGLNLRADRFRYVSEGFAWGPADSPVLLEGAWAGAPPAWLAGATAGQPDLEIVERRGCDLTPIDPLSPDGALALRAYVWPDQTARVARLDGALRVAARVPAEVEAAGAADFLAGVRLEPGTLTVVWHSIMRQYVPAAEWARVEAELDRLAAAATVEARFAHISFEPRRVGERHRFRLAVRLGTAAGTVVAEARPHGLPARAVAT
ncbi:DUF2332 domain-containing protein [Streptosporangium roseum]|uniref:DUF2332 domain-containing protein n=1 Tax=Streptosporangium roseum (strain ATCC 12428 / DSM 43021 / JCM 3005 / KCTC 9067 / NCIMB 10171 / NRRL 2505 / NI 9100) TaxID=479432 RepID=D2AYI2_STRRD|nr:DUF2332 domain-containing protein [Streptosporangium roseum]ACZ88965.1 conserved hypothetical protein [Streptosporangium roseum DSM 43021]